MKFIVTKDTLGDGVTVKLDPATKLKLTKLAVFGIAIPASIAAIVVTTASRINENSTLLKD